jgi:hypothetical protein
MKRAVTLVAIATALLTLAGAAAGCGGGASGDKPGASPSPQWEQVLTREVSGAQPIKVNLGTYALGNGVRLGWVLSGPTTKPPVALTFRIINTVKGPGYGNSVSSGDAAFSETNENAIVLAPIFPGKYTVFFSQRFPKAEGPGYDVKLTVSTFKVQK